MAQAIVALVLDEGKWLFASIRSARAWSPQFATGCARSAEYCLSVPYETSRRMDHRDRRDRRERCTLRRVTGVLASGQSFEQFQGME